MFPTDHMLGRQRNGLNHVSMNLAGFDRGAGPVRGTNYPVYADALLDWYQSKKVASARVLFTWEAVQPALDTAIPSNDAGYSDYWSDLMDVVNRLLARGIYVILGPWQYNANVRDTDIVYDSEPFSSNDFATFWGNFAAAVNVATGNDQRVAFDLINEPHVPGGGRVGISLEDWFAYAQAAIDAIRGTGCSNSIFVPGMDYTAAAKFTMNGSSTAWLGLADPLNSIAVTAHCYLDSGNFSPTALSDACSALIAWARSQTVKVNIGEIAIDAGDNGRGSFCSSFATAQAQWSDWCLFCAANSDVLVSWGWWANSAAGWWNDGDSCDPEGYHWGLTLDDGASQTIYMNLIESAFAN